MKAELRSSRMVYGIAKQHFASLEESQAASIDGFPWTSPENPEDFPWLIVDDLYVVLGDFKDEIDNISYCTVCVCDGSIVDDVSICGYDNVTRYCIVGDSTGKGNDTYIHEFEYDGEFGVNRLTIHYKTAARPGAPGLRLVTSVEYAGRQIYSAGRIVENCTMPSVGDFGTGEQARVEFFAGSYACAYMRDYTICNGWYKADGDDPHAWKLLSRENAPQTVVVPAFVDEIADDAFADCRGMKRLYVKEGVDSNERYPGLPGSVCLNCVKVPQSQLVDFFVYKPEYKWCGGRWNSVSNGFFSGTVIHDSEWFFKKSHGGQVRWLELRPREFQYICSLAFDLPRAECDEVGGRWLFTQSLESGNLLLQLASAFMDGTEVEQDFPMALRCCEQACWCATGNWIPFVPGDAFSGIEVVGARQYEDAPEGTNPAMVDLYERANELKEEVLTHFQRLEIEMFEERGWETYCIPDLAFDGREDLRDVLLPDELCNRPVSVGRYSFARCPNLRSITVAGMTDGFSISRVETSFLGCNSLSDRMQYSPDGSKLLFCLNAPEVCNVCGHVRQIGTYAFHHSTRMRYFIWDSVYCVDDETYRHFCECAFDGCCNLLRVSAEGREVEIRRDAFNRCRSLQEFEFGSCSSLISRLILHGGGFRDSSLQRIGTIDQVGLGYIILAGMGVFRGCSRLREIPPIATTFIRPVIFEGCSSLNEVRCIVTNGDAEDDIVTWIKNGRRPNAEPNMGMPLRIGIRAFNNCGSLRRFKCYRVRISLCAIEEEENYSIADVDLIESPPREVRFDRNAFMNCGRLSRAESSFARAAEGSDPTAFVGCPEFEGFVDGEGFVAGNDNEDDVEVEIGGPEDLLM